MREIAKQFTSAFAPPAPATATKPDTAFAEISSDVSHLPDLTGYLGDLLRTRERLAASIDGVDEWARADAMPAAEEIRRVRHLVSQIKADIDRMDAGRRAQIGEAVSVVRRHRALHLGMPSVRPVLPSPRTEASA